jgi:hypothetical protein
MKKLYLSFLLLSSLGVSSQEVINKAVVEVTLEKEIPSDIVKLENKPFTTVSAKTVYLDNPRRIVYSSVRGISQWSHFTQGQPDVINVALLGGKPVAYRQTPEEIAQNRPIDFNATRIEVASNNTTVNTGLPLQNRIAKTEPEQIEYIDESKFVNGAFCKKALVPYTDNQGNKRKAEVWYSVNYTWPEDMKHGYQTLLNLDELKGMAIRYYAIQMTTVNNVAEERVILYNVNSIELDKEMPEELTKMTDGLNIMSWHDYEKRAKVMKSQSPQLGALTFTSTMVTLSPILGNIGQPSIGNPGFDPWGVGPVPVSGGFGSGSSGTGSYGSGGGGGSNPLQPKPASSSGPKGQ